MLVANAARPIGGPIAPLRDARCDGHLTRRLFYAMPRRLGPTRRPSPAFAPRATTLIQGRRQRRQRRLAGLRPMTPAVRGRARTGRAGRERILRACGADRA